MSAQTASMKRLDALAAIYPRLDHVIVVTIMGAVAAELQSLGHRPNFFYLQHAMGLASSMGLGIALSKPGRKVVVFDGDGSLLMNLGALTTLARYRPGNLLHVVFDNESLLFGKHPRNTDYRPTVSEPCAVCNISGTAPSTAQSSALEKGTTCRTGTQVNSAYPPSKVRPMPPTRPLFPSPRFRAPEETRRRATSRGVYGVRNDSARTHRESKRERRTRGDFAMIHHGRFSCVTYPRRAFRPVAGW